MTMIDFIILALATWRMSSLLADEAGPFEVLERVRYHIGVRDTSDMIPYGTNELARGALCGWCNSIWIGFFWTALYLLWSPIVYFALPFAMSAVAVIVYGFLDPDGDDGGPVYPVAQTGMIADPEIEERLNRIVGLE